VTSYRTGGGQRGSAPSFLEGRSRREAGALLFVVDLDRDAGVHGDGAAMWGETRASAIGRSRCLTFRPPFGSLCLIPAPDLVKGAAFLWADSNRPVRLRIIGRVQRMAVVRATCPSDHRGGRAPRLPLSSSAELAAAPFRASRRRRRGGVAAQATKIRMSAAGPRLTVEGVCRGGGGLVWRR
jgi:hypothetical protein